MMVVLARTGHPVARVRAIVESLPFRIAVTLGLLAVVATHVDWSRMGHRLAHGHPLDFAAAVALVLSGLTVGAARWWRLLSQAGLHVPLRSLARVYTVATFSNTFLPTSVGGDVTRALMLARRPPLLTRVATTILVDRLGGLVGLLGMAWLSSILEPAAVPRGSRVFLAWVTAVVVVGGLGAVAIVFRGSALGRLLPSRLTKPARELRSVLRSYASNPLTVATLISSSLVYQALISLQLVMLALSIDVHLSFATAAVVLTLVTVVTLIPISIGGFGIREGSYVVLLGGASIGATDATLISVLSVAALFFASLPGAFMLARGGITPVRMSDLT